MKPHKIGIIGHFGFGLNLANGQTIKTKIVSKVLASCCDNDVIYVDAHGGIKAILPVFGGCIRLLSSCENVMILLTENGLRLALPTLVFFNSLFFHRKLHYNVIGGWLPIFLHKNKYLIPMLMKFNFIYTETNTMKKILNQMGLKNCITIPNCKELNILNKENLCKKISNPLKLCIFSRIMKEKGIEDAVNAIREINQQQGRTVYTLDLYGQVDIKQAIWFKQLSSQFPEYIRYRGIIPFAKSVETLKDYYALLFPTRFFTEGVPGTIIDAYAAGLPVISSKWQSFADVIDEGETGFGYEFANIKHLKNLLMDIATNPLKITNLKEKCVDKATEYTLDGLKNSLMKYIQ